MKGYIDNYCFAQLECMKYFAPPSSWSEDKKRQEAKNRIFSNDFYGARKMDGALYVFLKDEDGNITLRGRSKSVNGDYIDKYDHLPQIHEWAKSLPNGCCFLGEVYWPGHEGSYNTTSIMNCLTSKAIARQSKEENKLHYYIFDVLAFEEASMINIAALNRFNFLAGLKPVLATKYVEFAQYVNGEALWNLLQDTLACGGEGIVITHKNAKYEPGKRPSRTTLKVKRELSESLDVYFTGRAAAPAREYTGAYVEKWEYWINELTDERLPVGSHYYEASHDGAPYIAVTKPYYYHWAGSLEIAVWDGTKDISLGYVSGLTDEVKANYKNYAHTVIEVGAMQWMDSTKRTLRHARILNYRDDKKWDECTLSQI